MDGIKREGGSIYPPGVFYSVIAVSVAVSRPWREAVLPKVGCRWRQTQAHAHRAHPPSAQAVIPRGVAFLPTHLGYFLLRVKW